MTASPATFTPAAVLSPCIGICRLEADGLCAGCHRSGEEIAAWAGMGEAQRLHLMDVVLPARAARREPG
ncbi:hypothetical protein EDC34_103273 [Thermomonas haemolytica]|uniref:Fe-S protein YdhL (DUF1289 family) n=1 Tax=Thermomonas haemolytica TaxID=141949 RepID=A0A4R3N6P5_9GAMM|nr:hypothetical protein EDC34_103273 [Thermomonas haemolytica]